MVSPTTSRTGLLGTIFNGFGSGGNNAATRKNDVPAEASSPVALARIDRMEKEQREQKAMLAQILGAIQNSQNRGG